MKSKSAIYFCTYLYWRIYCKILISEDIIGNWLDCVVDSDYEIYDQYPYPIRRKGGDKVIKESIKNNGYIQCKLNQHAFLKHRIIALQFIENDDPDNKTEVDHINHNRTDNRIENLRWVSHSDNNSNRSRSTRRGIEYEYFDEIPFENDEDEIIEVNEYGNHEFNNLFFYKDEFYIYNGIQYRKAYISYNSCGNAYIQTYDTNHKNTTINYIKFKRLYGLI